MTMNETITDYFNMGIDRIGQNIHQYVFNYKIAVERRRRSVSALGILSDKWLTNQILKSGGVATTSPIIYKTAFIGADETLEKIRTSGYKTFFAKINKGSKGRGAFVFTMNENGFEINGEKISDKNLVEKLEGCIVEPLIEQHETMNSLFPHAVASLRLVTVCKKGQIHIIQSALGLGVGENRTSNIYQGGILVGVKTDGTLSDYGLILRKNRGKHTSHPDTGIVFKNFKLPYWKEATELAIKAHKCFPGFFTVGWDIAITKNGPLILEGNRNWASCSFQYTDGPGKERMKKWFTTL